MLLPSTKLLLFPLTTIYLLFFVFVFIFFLSSTSAWELRFGTNNIVETRKDSTGIYGTVCDDNFDLSSARGLCKAMGANADPSAVWFFNRDGTSSAGVNPAGTSGVPIWMINLNCSSATSAITDFDAQCRYNSSYPQSIGSCQHSEDIGMFCFPWSVELNPTTKVLQVRPGMNRDPLLTQVGTVCASGSPPDKSTALALCKLVGFSATATLEYSKAWYATPGSTSEATPVYLRNIHDCPLDVPLPGYSQISLDQCQMEYLPALTGSSTGCSGHNTDVALTCAKQPSYRHPSNPAWEIDIASSATSGSPVRVRPNATAPWGTICSDRMSTATATSICRMYNQGSYGSNQLDMSRVYASWSTSAQSRKLGTGVIYVDELECADSATSINTCQYVYSDDGSRRNDCDHSEDTVVFCDEWSFVEEPRTRRLLVRPSAVTTATSGTVCGDGFGLNEARAVCRFLGYTSGIDKVNFALYGSGSADEGGSNPNSRPVYLSSMKCPSDASSIQQCTFRRNADPSDLAAGRGLANGCSHSFDIKIDCNGTSGTPTPDAPGFFTSEIIIAVLTPAIIILFCIVFLVVRYFAKAKEGDNDNNEGGGGRGGRGGGWRINKNSNNNNASEGQRSPGSQALTGMTSAIGERSGRGGATNMINNNSYRPGSSFAPEIVRSGRSGSGVGGGMLVDHGAFNLDPRPSPRSPNFESVADPSSPVHRQQQQQQQHAVTNRNYRVGGVERPLPPQAGSAAVVNPFGRTAPVVVSSNNNTNRYRSPVSGDIGRFSGPAFADL